MENDLESKTDEVIDCEAIEHLASSSESGPAVNDEDTLGQTRENELGRQGQASEARNFNSFGRGNKKWQHKIGQIPHPDCSPKIVTFALVARELCHQIDFGQRAPCHFAPKKNSRTTAGVSGVERKNASPENHFKNIGDTRERTSKIGTFAFITRERQRRIAIGRRGC